MIDWFLILTPLVLFPIVLLFAFAGCTGTFQASSEKLSLLLLSSTHLPTPSLVVFTWESPSGSDSGPAELRHDPVEVEGEQYWEFEYVIQEPQEGLWTITCSVYGEGRQSWGLNACEFYRPAHSWLVVSFELISRDEANNEFEVVKRVCPPSE